MSLPGGVSMLVDEDELINRIELDDRRTLFVTPSRAIAYRERSMLTEESVESYPTDLERLTLEEGKRQVTVTFEYPDEADRTLDLPKSSMAAALKALLASVIRATDVLEADEDIEELYRFNELTVVLTDRRLIKHVGHALWGETHEAIDYEIIRDLHTEEGQVSTGVIIETTGATERFKLPKDSADRFIAQIEDAVCAYHDVAALGVLRGNPDAGKPEPEPDLDRLRPLQVSEDDDPGATVEGEPAAMSSDGNEELLEYLHELEDTIEQQQAQLDQLRDTLEQLENRLTRDQ